MRYPPLDVLTARHGRIRAALSDERLDALVVTHLANVRYATGFAGSAAAAVVTRDTVVLITDARYLEEVRSELAGPGLTIVPADPSYDEALAGVLAALPAGRVGVEAASLTVGRYQWLGRRLAGGRSDLVVVDRVVERARLRKDAAEQDTLRRAAALLDGVVAESLAACRAGQAEREVAADVDVRLKRAGFERPAFDTIVASGPNAARPHARPGDRRLADGDVVVLDCGGVLDGYCVDMTRTAAVGTPAPWVRDAWAAVADAQAAAIRAIRPGATASGVDAAARGTLASRGLGDVFVHSTGHGLGLEVHEEPRLGPLRTGPDGLPVSPDAVLAPGMVVTVEPGVYLAGRGGIRIEDDVLVTGDGCAVLTQAPRELFLVSR